MNDSKPTVDIFGKKITGSDHVDDVFKHTNGITNFVNEIKE